MELLFICRDARVDSLLSTMAMALEARKASVEAGISFTGEAIAAMAGRSFDWSPLLRDWSTRVRVSRNATEMGHPLSNPRGPRWTKPVNFSRPPGRRESGPLWSKMLGVDERLPEDLERPDMAELIHELRQSYKVIGSY
ncbi:MAG: hypothetical protein FI709_11485 [SAR202 cluster bacterium]|nr:hypothetical protein [SAR202 cluster bacterium]|tara:strand:- start:4178 stop:4594 length:417 start_codon:yes stop_codon:yes gene_type:complete